MAKIINRERAEHKELYVVLNKGEAVKLIGLLSALLGDVNFSGHPIGAIPSFVTNNEHDQRIGELFITLE